MYTFEIIRWSVENLKRIFSTDLTISEPYFSEIGCDDSKFAGSIGREEIPGSETNPYWVPGA